MDIKIKNYSFLRLELLAIEKKNGVTKIYDLGGFQSRNKSMIKIFKYVFTNYDIKDFNLTLINTGDNPINKNNRLNILSFSEKKGYLDIGIPDFIYDCWKEVSINSFEEESEKLKLAGENKPLEKKIG